ncbi:hypothetical protein AMTR_s00023p00234910 [Amborella trichopoda]|uniref:Aminotransferase-like plant mobile domain-containing protein n=1 Tax=Amborella trichopoda TaxID=13333 RepID=W1NJV6_AMBTC|nr:hypothetical protein AMTR_s00023p00234910 [Amborella trichopoda]
MTPTLFDIYEILGLAVDGEPITCRPINDLQQYIEDNLGMVADGNLKSLRHTWLKANFRKLTPDATSIPVYRYTRAYMLFLISLTIFVDALVSTVPTRYLQFFEDIEGASKYAWGVTTVAFLYQSLGRACTFKLRHFSGSTTLMHMRPIPHNISPNLLKAKRWEPPKKYYGNPHNLMPLPLDKNLVTSNLMRQKTFETTMCLTTLIFYDIVEPYMPDRVRWQFGAKQSIPKNPLVGGKRASRQGGHQDWRNVNANKIHQWLSLHERMRPDIQVVTDNGLPSDEYKAWYNLVSHPLVSVVQASTVMLVEALTLRHKWYSKDYNRVNNVFETLSKLVLVDMDDIKASMTSLQREYQNDGVPDEAGHDEVGESSRAVEDLAPSTQLAVEEPRKYNTRKKQYQPKRRRPM